MTDRQFEELVIDALRLGKPNVNSGLINYFLCLCSEKKMQEIIVKILQGPSAVEDVMNLLTAIREQMDEKTARITELEQDCCEISEELERRRYDEYC